MNQPLTRRHWLLGVTAGAAAASAGLPRIAHAADGYPSGVVTLVVPYSAGGQFDGLARVVAKAMDAELGRQVIVENVAGAGGNIAASRVARAKPDGHTLLLCGGNFALATILFRKLDFDPMRDFVPISLVSVAPHVIMASKPSGITSFEQLRERAANGRLSYGSPGVGTSMHLTMEMVKDRLGLNILHVPYRGGANVMTDLVGGQIDLGIIAVGPALEFIRNDKVAALAVTSGKRSPQLPQVPQVPSLAELGLQGMDEGSWSGIAAPAGTPAPVIAKLNAAVHAALATPEVKRVFDEQSFTAIAGTPAKMREFLLAEGKRYAPLIKKLKLAQ